MIDAHTLLLASMHALRSYQFGNGSPELAEELADKIAAWLNRPEYVGESRWIDAKVRVPCDGDIVLIGGFGYKGGFWSDAKYVDEEFLMFDQEADRYCWPCKRVLWWQPLPPLPPRDESPLGISGSGR